ncbi:hypothetical protein ACX80N_16740 [Arthrobacter sp. MDT2-16]
MKELLLLPEGPPEGVWQAALDFALTNADDSRDDSVMGGISVDSARESEADLDGGTEDDDFTPLDQVGEDDLGPSAHGTSEGVGAGFNPDDVSGAGEDYG